MKKQFITEARRLQELAGIKETRFDTTQIKDLLDRITSYSDKTFIWFDTETSGFTFDRPLQITQIAAIATDNEGNKIGQFNEKAKLDPKIAKAAEDPESGVSKALGINRYFDDKSDKREQQLILSDFVDWVNSFPNPILLIYNTPFDMEVFNTVSKGKKLKSTTLDVMKIAQYFWIPLQQQLAEKGDERSIEILNKLGTSGSGNLVGSTLGKVANSLGIDNSQAHDAFGDVIMTSGIYREMLKDLEQHQNVEIDKEYRRGRIAADLKFKRKDKENRERLKKSGNYTVK